MPESQRERTVLPLAVPLGIFLAIGILIFLFSRILLNVPRAVAVAVALMTAVNILVTCAIVSMRRVRGVALGMLALVLAVPMLLGAGTAAKIFTVKVPQPKVVVAAQTVTVIAKNTAFSTASLTAKPGNLTIDFKNEETSPISHDMQFFDGPTSSSPVLYTGAIISSGASATYELKDLKPGTYYYRCLIHPTIMTGTLTVSGSGGSNSAAPGGGPTPGPVHLTAKNLAFSLKTITISANTPTTVVFDNADTAAHNFDIVSGPAGYTKPAGVPTIASPGQTVTYNVPALPAGTYKFQCDIHPTLMFGTLNVVASGGGAPTATATASPTATATASPSAAPASGIPASGPIQLTAQNLAFSLKTITISANTPTTVVLDNKDVAPHNFDIVSGPAGYTKPSGLPTLANPGQTVTYNIPALPPGTYKFQCDIHPTLMFGTLTVQ